MYMWIASSPIQVKVAKRKKCSRAATAMHSPSMSKEVTQPSRRKTRFRRSRAELRFIKILEG
jgi:hypothetical protein